MVLEKRVDVDSPTFRREWGPVPKNDGEVDETEMWVAVPVVNAGRQMA
jgi:hypothetical protein